MIKTIVIILVALLALSIPVAAVLGNLGLILSQAFGFLPLHRAIADVAWGVSNDTILVSVPFFILLGEIFLRAGLAERMYNAMVQWLSWLPGGLMHANIGSCTLFAATSGSSVATAATIGTVAIGEVEKHGYNERLFLGTLAAGGTLGILIPPSINLIIYGAMTNTSVPKLYLAGVVPGFLLAFLFMVVTYIACLFRPKWGGRPIKTTWANRFRVLPDVVPSFIIFFSIIGSIYLGLATPTESAALGVLAALALSAWNRQLTLANLRAAIEGTIRTSGMIMAILMGAYFLNFVMASIGVTTWIQEFMTGLGLSPFLTLMVIIAFYVVLGMFMETLSMMVATIPITTPIIVGLGYDPVWFGILLVVLVEMAMITPPVGINLYVIQGIRVHGPVLDVIVGSLPFVIAMFVLIALLVGFPEIALYMPTVLAN